MIHLTPQEHAEARRRRVAMWRAAEVQSLLKSLWEEGVFDKKRKFPTLESQANKGADIIGGIVEETLLCHGNPTKNTIEARVLARIVINGVDYRAEKVIKLRFKPVQP